MRRLAVCAIMGILASLSCASAQEKLRFSAFEAPNLTPAAEKILTRAYAELGVRIETVVTTPRRALVEAASGKTDGELVRVRSIGDLHSTLIRVDVPVVVARTFAYTDKPELKGKSLEELKSSRVGHVAGARFADELSEGFAEVWTADRPEQLLEMLVRDRIDLVILGEDAGKRLIREMALAGVFPLQPSLKTVEFYHFLHEKHADLVPRIEQVLRRVLQSGQNDNTDEEMRSESRNVTVFRMTSG